MRNVPVGWDDSSLEKGPLAMPLYFIDTSDGDLAMRDEEGLVLADDQAARVAALAALPDMARDKMPDGDRHSPRLFATLPDDRFTGLACISKPRGKTTEEVRRDRRSGRMTTQHHLIAREPG